MEHCSVGCARLRSGRRAVHHAGGDGNRSAQQRIERIDPVLRRLHAYVVVHAVVPVHPIIRRHVPLPLSEISMLLVTSRCVKPICEALTRSTFEANFRLSPPPGERAHRPRRECARFFRPASWRSYNSPAASRPTTCRSIGAGKPKFRIWLVMFAGWKKKVMSGKLLAQTFAEHYFVVACGAVLLFFQRNQDLAVGARDRRDIALRHGWPTVRDSDVVDDRIRSRPAGSRSGSRVRWQRIGARSLRCACRPAAGMQPHLAGIDIGKEILAHQPQQPQRSDGKTP